MVALCAALAPASAAQRTEKVALEASETLFSVLAAINLCGYDHELNLSDPLRAEIRAQVAQAAQFSPGASRARDQLCHFYIDHQQVDPARDLAQYVSLALVMGPPPEFELAIKAADLPPDAAYVLGIIPLLQRFHHEAGMGELWNRYRPRHESYIEQLNPPVTRVLEETDIYLRMPVSGYLGRSFRILVDVLGAPGPVNARQYADEYFVVATLSGGQARMDPIRHTYLHFVLDPLLLKRANTLRRVEPLLRMVQDAPMDESFKRDAALLTTESLIRAVEIRMKRVPGANAGRVRNAEIENAMAEGFVLTRYFAEQLAAFEDEPAGFQTAFPEMLYQLDGEREARRARQTRFALRATPEVLRASNRRQTQILDLAEERLATGDAAAAQQLARQALEERSADPGRAYFILARAATLNRDMPGAQQYFERTLEHASEARVLAWAHIYLGRIFDLQEDREAALKHYRAALAAGDTMPETRAAAERGLQQAYEPPRSRP